MQKKLLIIILLIIGIAVMSTALMTRSAKTVTVPQPLQVYPAGQAPAFNDPVFIVIPTPTLMATETPVASKSATGAILVPPPAPETEAYRELFALLSRGIIQQPTFTIRPVPLERKITIAVRSPFETNFATVQKWLTSNGYGNIPAKNILYVQGN